MRILYAIFLVFGVINLYSQDEWDEITVYEEGGLHSFTQYEIGLSYSSSSVEGGAGILARYQLNSSTFVRASIEGFGRSEFTRISNDYNNGGGIRLGIAKRKWMGTDLFWNYGVHVGLGLSFYEDKPDNYTGQSFSTGLIGGINYIIHEQFMVGFEILPMVLFSRYSPEDNLPNSLDTSETDLVFLPSVNLMYRF